jgi:DNA-binding CsgD family transcriptional regulator/tetratricopeptide (TPR) repeat protein
VLRSRANSVIGRSKFFLSEFEAAEAAFEEGQRDAQDDVDKIEAIFGLATTRIFAERGDPSLQMRELAEGRHLSPDHFLRHAAAALSWRRWEGGLRDLALDAPRSALRHVDDPRARTAFTYGAAHALGQRADYAEALEYLRLFATDTETFGLTFARPYMHWTKAFLSLGLRKFGEAERQLQLIEEAVERNQHPLHDLNARILRSRMLMQIGRHDEALAMVTGFPRVKVFPSWLGELEATRALALACNNQARAARRSASEARGRSQCLEVRILAAAAEAVAGIKEGSVAELETLFSIAEELAIWDPVVCALRAEPKLAPIIAAHEGMKHLLTDLIDRTGDTDLGRRTGIRVRSKRVPDELLSSRELEVLDLMARGLRNKEIARSLFIAESTVKVHVRHVLERLGVRTRAEAVARYERVASHSSGEGNL